MDAAAESENAIVDGSLVEESQAPSSNELRRRSRGVFTAGVLTLDCTVLVVYVQAVTQLLPFAMG